MGFFDNLAAELDAVEPDDDDLAFLDGLGDVPDDPEPEAPRDDRNLFARVNDFMIDTGNAASGMAKAGVDLFAPGSDASQSIGEFIQGGVDDQSDYRKNLRQYHADLVAEAKQNGDTGALQTLDNYLSNPVTVLLPEALGAVGPVAAVGKVAQGARLLGGGSAAAGESAGLAATSASGAAIGGGSVRGGFYESIQSTSDEQLRKENDQYDLLRETLDERSAKHKIGQEVDGSLAAGMVAGGGLGLIAGRMGAESALFGGKGGVLRTGAIEAGTEALQGGSEQLATNIAVQSRLPSQSLSEDVALSAAQEGIVGAPGGAVSGLAGQDAKPKIKGIVDRILGAATVDEATDIALAATGETLPESVDEIMPDQAEPLQLGYEPSNVDWPQQLAQPEPNLTRAQANNATSQGPAPNPDDIAADHRERARQGIIAREMAAGPLQPADPAIADKANSVDEAFTQREKQLSDTRDQNESQLVESVRDQQLEQETAKTSVGGFNDPQPTAMALAMGKALEPAATVDETAHEGATDPSNDLPEPDDNQKRTGNYLKAKVQIGELNIEIENAKGSTRSGKDANGRTWSRKLKSHYGELPGTLGADGDPIDVFIKPSTATDYDGPVFVIDQLHAGDPQRTGDFDESKAVIGASTEKEALIIYRREYEKGWNGVGAVTQMSMSDFKSWAHSDAAKNPASPNINLTEETDGANANQQPADTEGSVGNADAARDGDNGPVDAPRGQSESVAQKEGERADGVPNDGAAIPTESTTPKATEQARIVGRQEPEPDAALDKSSNDREEQANASPSSVSVSQNPDSGDTKASTGPGDSPSSLPKKKTTPVTKKEPVDEPGEFGSNKVFTPSAAKAAEKSLPKDGKAFDKVLTPEQRSAGINYAGAVVESGSKDFESFSKVMRDKFGKSVTPQLRDLYEGVRAWPFYDGKGMTSKQDVVKAKSAARKTAKTGKPDQPDKPVFSRKAGKSPDQVAEEFAAKWKDDPDALIEAYANLPESVGGKIINADIARQLSPDYDKDNQSRTLYGQHIHQTASEITKGLYRRALERPVQSGLVTLTAGGGGSGKSSGLEIPAYKQAIDNADIVFDGTFGGLDSSVKRIEAALKLGNRVAIIYTHRNADKAMMNGVVPRAVETGRIVPIHAFLRAHQNALANVRKVNEKYKNNPNVAVIAVLNEGGFSDIALIDLDNLAPVKYRDLEQKLLTSLEKEYQNGRISKEIYQAITGRASRFSELHPVSRGSDSRGVSRDGSRQGNPGNERERGSAVDDHGNRDDQESRSAKVQGGGATSSGEAEGGVADPDSPSNDSPKFSRQASATNSAQTNKIQAIANALKTAMPNATEITVLDSIEQAPKEVRDAAANGATPEAVFYNGEILLFADQLSTPQDIVRAVMHETLGHHGLRGAFGDSLNEVLDKVIAGRRREVIDRTKAEGLDPNDQNDLRIGAEELLAYMAQERPDASHVKGAIKTIGRVVNKVLRAVGVNRPLSNSEIIKDYLLPARGWVERSNGDQSNGDQARFGRANETQTASVFDDFEESKFDDLIYSLQDKHVDTKRVVQAITKKSGEIDDKWNAYLQEELYHGRTASQTKQFLDKEVKPLLVQMQASGVTLAQLGQYLHARHAQERNEQNAKTTPDMPDGGSGMKTAHAKRFLNAMPAGQKAKMQSLANRIDRINKGTQQILIDSGLEKQSTVDAWNKAYKNYVPLHRDEASGRASGSGQGYSVRGSSTKRSMGSSKDVVDILANIVMQRENTITRAEKNKVSVALWGMAAANPKKALWKAVDPALFRKKDGKGRAKLEAELVAMGMNPIDAQNVVAEPKQRYIDPRTGLTTERVNPLLRSADNVVSARVDGEEIYVMFNENDDRAMRMAGALKNLDADQLGRVLGISAKISRYFASINTQYNPVFGIKNFVRDVQGAALNLSTTKIAGKEKEVMSQTMSALAGIYKDLRATRKGDTASSKWSQLFEEFEREGGKTGYRDLFVTSADRAANLEKEIKMMTEGKTKAGGRAVFDWLSDYNEAIENSVRLAAYKVAKDDGHSREQAASIAKNLTVNFNRKGQATMQAGALYAFFNASVQGTARMYETIKGPAGKKILGGGLLLGAVQALALSVAGFDEDEPPEFIRERNVIIPIGGGKYITIPMPLGLHIIPNIGRIPMEFMLGGMKDPSDSVFSLINVFADGLSPVGSAGLSMQTIAPTPVDMFAALAENKDFSGRQISRDNFSSLNPKPGHARAKDTASFLARWASEGFNAMSGGTDYKPGALSPTPDQIDYLFGQVTGGVGREASKLLQMYESASTGKELPPYKIPLLGSFYGNTDSQAGQSSKFYKNVREINGHKAEIKGRRGDRQDVSGYIRDNPSARFTKMTDRTYRAISKLRKTRRRLIDQDASPKRIKQVEQIITDRMTRFNERVNQANQR